MSVPPPPKSGVVLSPTGFFLLVINILYAFFGTFGVVDALTKGGPGQSTNILFPNKVNLFKSEDPDLGSAATFDLRKWAHAAHASSPPPVVSSTPGGSVFLGSVFAVGIVGFILVGHVDLAFDQDEHLLALGALVGVQSQNRCCGLIDR